VTAGGTNVRTLARRGAVLCSGALLCCPALAQGQNLYLGLQGGLNLASQRRPGVSLETKPGVVVGGSLALRLGPTVAVRSEVNYAQKGSRGEGLGEQLTLHMNYVEVPILAQLLVPLQRVPVVPRLSAGPSIAFRLRCAFRSKSLPREGSDCDSVSTDVDTGLAIGAGIGAFAGPTLLTLDARYTVGLRSVMGDIKNRVFTLLAGLSVPLPM